MSEQLKQILVTVGTTKFEDLIKNIDKKEFYETLIKNKFNKLIIQMGYGEYTPIIYKNYSDKINIEIYKILNNFGDVIKKSDLIVSHGGAGIILESLHNNKKVIVCVNETLMGNHQVELASSLEDEGYVCYPKKLSDIDIYIDKVCNNEIKLKDYPDTNKDAIPNVIYEMLGINIQKDK